ncbi:MAG TPA: SpoIIE family protein phosphatase, partial [Solirubrobacteraceae bacterium]|nr:SpoIIE family protein phosphatase [Solirubrobacteraceae bacterium]
GAGGTLGPPLEVVLHSAERPVGLLEVRDTEDRGFTARDEAILAQLGQLAAVAIAKSQAYSRERHISQVLQRSLLPSKLPDVPSLSAAVRFIAAGEGIEVGGDFYDFFSARPGHAAALIGDVCGKGPEAASVTALARHTLRAAAAYESRPSALLQLLHRALRAARDDGRFCTVAYAELEPHDRGATMTVACGGHPLPLVIRRSGLVEPVGQLGTLLGTDLEPRLTDVEVALEHGELVVLYTDGVTEVRAGRREIFGHRDLALLLAACAGLPPDVVARRVQDAVLDAASGRPRDDIAILVVGPSPGTDMPSHDATRHPEVPHGRP